MIRCEYEYDTHFSSQIPKEKKRFHAMSDAFTLRDTHLDLFETHVSPDTSLFLFIITPSFLSRQLTYIFFFLSSRCRPSQEEIKSWSESFDKLMKCPCKYFIPSTLLLSLFSNYCRNSINVFSNMLCDILSSIFWPSRFFNLGNRHPSSLNRNKYAACDYETHIECTDNIEYTDNRGS